VRNACGTSGQSRDHSITKIAQGTVLRILSNR
jgi:hypothetical protein